MRAKLLAPLIFLVPLAGACGGAQRPAAESGATPPATTAARLAGHRCTLEACTCRQIGVEADQAEQQAPPPGHRRFEVRLEGAPGVVWALVAGQHRLYKSPERAEECFYLDLPHGEHPVVIRAAAEQKGGSVGVAAAIREHGPEGWYDSFTFACGVPGPCDVDTLRAWKADVTRDRTLITDHCGAVRVQGLTYETGRLPDRLHPQDLEVRFTMRVSATDPAYPPRSEDCPKR